MSDLITRKPTAPMTELLRRGAASPKGIMTLLDHNCRTQDGILRRELADVVPEPGATHSWLVINDRGRAYLAKLDGAQQQAAKEQQEAPQEPASAPVTAVERPAAPEVQDAPAAPVAPALEGIARVVVETVTLGRGDTARVRPSYVVHAYGSTHEFADIDGTWVEVCGRCGGEGRMDMYAGIHQGVCYGCNTSGLRPDIFTGTREQRDAFVLAWARKKNGERKRDEARAARIQAKREAAWARWSTANAELLAWCLALTPDSVEEYPNVRQTLEDTQEAAERLFPGETLEASGRFTEGAHAGKYWADLKSVERHERFNSYGSKAAHFIQEARRQWEPLDARGTALLRSVMARAVAAEASTRYAGPVGAEVSVTGRVKRVQWVDGYESWQPMRRMVVLEGTGEHAGIEVTAYSASKAAEGLQEGQEGVTMSGTVSKHKEYSGARQTTV
jgi:hypothetical protein